MEIDRRPRGRAALDEVHYSITGQDEPRLDAKISALYGVDNEESTDIHSNYHMERIIRALEHRTRANGLPAGRLAEHLSRIDVLGLSRQVASGVLAEAAACDLVFKILSEIELNGKSDDRYIRFYG